MTDKCGRVRHLVIPDCQVRPGVDIEHMTWIGRAIVEYRPDIIINLGDFWDMSALNSYDSPRKMERRRLKDDVAAGNHAMTQLLAPLRQYQRRHKRWHQYHPRMVFLMGNHENRVTRTVDQYPLILDGLVGLNLLNLKAWETHDFLETVPLDGVYYSHYFYNPNSGRPYGGTAHTKLRNIGVSFTMGHQQGLDYALRHTVDGKTQYGLIAGSCYTHNEDYRGPQATGEWRGIIIKNDVRDGMYDIMPLTLEYLRSRFA